MIDYYLFPKRTRHYSYDVHGNVATLLQDNPSLASIGQRFKRTDYDYDLISSNINDVHYQNGQPDAFDHHYEYDADNRITQVYTSRFPTAQWAGYKDQFWDNDANYYYYKHGLIARVEIGDNQLQGVDYAYTIQGWVKGVNSEALQPRYDMGKDGLYASANPNKTFAKDAFGYSLTFFTGDYNAIYNGWKTDSTSSFTASQYLASHVPSDLPSHRYNLYNGNIGTMVSSITNPGVNTSMPLANAYRYDQLNRIVQAQSFQELQSVTNNWNNEDVVNSSLSPAYYNTFSYDENGNILSQLRKDIIGTSIDSLIYNYAHDSNNELFQNRLYSVNDPVPANRFSDDIDDQGVFHDTLANINFDNNYSYDGIGQLKKDSAEQIQSITWTLYNKIKSINRYPGSSKQNLVFDYDASDNRIAKHIYTSANVWVSSTYYVRDLKGNVMTTYEEKSNGSSLSYRVKEHDMYGTSRLGSVIDSVQMIGATIDTVNYCRVLGQKEYEMTNHLGNVVTVVSDKKVAQDPMTPLSLYNSPNLVRTTIDSLGGMKMQPLAQNGGMNFSFKSVIGQNYQVDFYVNLANTNSGDMLQFAYPSSSSNSLSSTGHYTFNFSATDTLSSIMPYYGATGSTPNHYFLFDSLKIVATGTTLDSIEAYNAQIVNISDYSSFGAPLYGRQYSLKGQYRYGFNGKEKDNEIFGVGNSYAFEYRIQDPRLGRFLSIDPLTKNFANLSPYQFASNTPLRAVDIEGLETSVGLGVTITLGSVKQDNGSSKTVYKITEAKVTGGMNVSTPFGAVAVKGSATINEKGKVDKVQVGGVVNVNVPSNPSTPEVETKPDYDINITATKNIEKPDNKQDEDSKKKVQLEVNGKAGDPGQNFGTSFGADLSNTTDDVNRAAEEPEEKDDDDSKMPKVLEKGMKAQQPGTKGGGSTEKDNSPIIEEKIQQEVKNSKKDIIMNGGDLKY